MKTLKKALSLVLVLAMVLSLGVSAFAVDAKNFSDYGTIKNTAAVDVLAAIGVINGNTDGTFGPEGNFTRAQAATMISYLMLGSTIANALPTGATQFTDVPATHWASKYVQYCANEGIINGYGNGKFGPDDTLTVNQWALMLLGALGYKASNEKIGGSGWEIQVTKLAISAGIATPDDLVATFNRDMAAKMAFNTLSADVVEYGNEATTVTINGAVISTGASKASPKAQTGYTDNMQKANLQFAEKNFTKLAVTTYDTDNYGRPAAKWTLNNKPVATSAIVPVLSATASMTSKEVYDALGLTANTGTATAVPTVENGVAAADTNVYKGDTTNAHRIGGNGIVTEVYKYYASAANATAGTYSYKIVQINPSLGKITSITNGKDANKAEYKNYSIDNVAAGKLYTKTVDNETSTVILNGEVSKGDYVMYYKVKTGGTDADPVYTCTISPVTLVEGTLTNFSSKTGQYTISGTTYSASATTSATAPTAYNTKATYALDTYGYVVKAVTVDVPENYVYVLKTYESYSLNGSKLDKVMLADVVKTNGTVETITVDLKTTGIGTAGLYTYAVNEEDVYELTPVNAPVTSITQKESAIASGVRANASTVFMFVNWKDDTKSTADDDANDKSLTGTVTSYTGINNVPSITNATGAYVDADGNGIAEVVFVYRSDDAGVTINYTYFLGSFETVNGTKFNNDAIVAGETTQVTMNSRVTTAGLYTVTSGVAEAVDFSSDQAWAKGTDGIYGNKYLTINGGLLYVSAAAESVNRDFVTTIADSVPVYVISAVGGTCETTTAGALENVVNGDIVICNNGTTIEAIYVVAD